MLNRSDYVTMVWVYRKRRDQLKKKYKQGERGQRVMGLTIKIKNWQLQIRRIDKKSSRAANLAKSINNYFSVNIHSRKLDEQHKLARRVYYKIGIEMRLPGRFLVKEIGRKDHHIPTDSRRVFTASFRTNSMNKILYHKFKAYVENNKL